jgi:hypothetical protein
LVRWPELSGMCAKAAPVRCIRSAGGWFDFQAAAACRAVDGVEFLGGGVDDDPEPAAVTEG